ncbi:MAG: TetR/AcrR family transcriptional regulator, partial [Actinomycetota bacterium]|nr:TetR/AcrR family transcriptional regulator [Actinomycetota bacterium]
MVEAARLLFVRDGYASTTIHALAEEAGVAVQTIYASFGSKREVLKELFDTSVVGDDEQVALADRPEWRDWEEESEPARQIELFARAQRMV